MKTLYHNTLKKKIVSIQLMLNRINLNAFTLDFLGGIGSDRPNKGMARLTKLLL